MNFELFFFLQCFQKQSKPRILDTWKTKTACAIKIIPYRNVAFYLSFYLILVKVYIIHSCSCYFNFINTPSKKNDSLEVCCACNTFESCFDQTFLLYGSVLQRNMYIYWFSVYLTKCTKTFGLINLNDKFILDNKTRHKWFTINW